MNYFFKTTTVIRSIILSQNNTKHNTKTKYRLTALEMMGEVIKLRTNKVLL